MSDLNKRVTRFKNSVESKLVGKYVNHPISLFYFSAYEP